MRANEQNCLRDFYNQRQAEINQLKAWLQKISLDLLQSNPLQDCSNRFVTSFYMLSKDSQEDFAVLLIVIG